MDAESKPDLTQNENMTLEEEVETMLLDSALLTRIGDHLLQVDSKHSCNYDDVTVKEVHEGINTIVQTILNKLPEVDVRFEGSIVPMGSFYDGLKVGDPDEFDVMIQMTKLSEKGDVKYHQSEPGFSSLTVLNDHGVKWPTTLYCLHHQVLAEDATLSCSCGARNIVRALDPRSVQKAFRAATDKILSKITLPTNWVHGGFKRPEFGGYRRHGPATLYQFVWNSPHRCEEIKVSLDLTLAIKVPKPTNLRTFQLDLSPHYSAEDTTAARKLQHLIEIDPGIHVIPLYSKLLISQGKGDKKYNWRASCSLAEKQLMMSYESDSLVKTLNRVLKILRDRYLTYYKRRTRRGQRRKKRKGDKQRRSSQHQNVDSDEDSSDGDNKVMEETQKLCENQYQIARQFEKQCNMRNEARDKSRKPLLVADDAVYINNEDSDGICWFTEDEIQEHKLDKNYNVIRREWKNSVSHLGKQQTAGDDSDDDSIVVADSKSKLLHKGSLQNAVDSMIYAEPRFTKDEEDSDAVIGTTDVTEVNDEPSSRVLTTVEDIDNLRRYQQYDVGLERTKPEPGTGEYWGPGQYLVSVEIKVLLFYMLFKSIMDPAEASQPATARGVGYYVLKSLSLFHQVLLSDGGLRSLYTTMTVCTPLSSQKRPKALEAIKSIIYKLRDDIEKI